MGSDQEAAVIECVTCGQPCNMGSSTGGSTHFYLPIGGPADGAPACVTCGGKISNGFKAPAVPRR